MAFMSSKNVQLSLVFHRTNYSLKSSKYDSGISDGDNNADTHLNCSNKEKSYNYINSIYNSD